jgi:hypothetical protein
MLRQIGQALDNIDSKGKKDQDQIKAILKRYAEGMIGLDEAYYELLESDLIPMPQRCGMYAKAQTTAADEERLKKAISDMLAST